jgi:hypothetical protein
MLGFDGYLYKKTELKNSSNSPFNAKICNVLFGQRVPHRERCARRKGAYQSTVADMVAF